MSATDAVGKAGDLVLFSCCTITSHLLLLVVYGSSERLVVIPDTAHHSFANRSDQQRRALLYTYNPVSDGDTCKYTSNYP